MHAQGKIRSLSFGAVHRRGRWWLAALLGAVTVLGAAPARAEVKPVGASDGAYTQTIGIEVPPFHGSDAAPAMSYG